MVAEIISLMDTYKSLRKQWDFKQAGDAYMKLTERVFKKLTQDMSLFQSVVDDLLYLTENPSVQIEIATEAIGMNYRKAEAIQILEEYALWKPGMSIQDEAGSICNTAQMRLHNILGYTLNYEDNTWERSLAQEITPIFKQFYENRAKNSIDLNGKFIGYADEEGKASTIVEILSILPDDEDCFLLRCLTTDGTICYLSISYEGDLLQVYEDISHMETFRNGCSIFCIDHLSESALYGVMKKDGEICIPPIHKEISRINDYFFVGSCAELQGHLYDCTGQMIRENINIYEIIANDSPTYIYGDILYDEKGLVIADLSSIGSNWASYKEISGDVYEGFGLAGSVVQINALGQVLPFMDNEGDKKVPLDSKGEVYILRNNEAMSIHMDGKTYDIIGDVHVVLRHFSNQYFLLYGEWESASYLWIDRKKKKWTFYKDAKCTSFDYWFAKEIVNDAEFWAVMDMQGKKCVTEKQKIAHVYEGREQDSWVLENAELLEVFFLPRKKKLIKKEKVIRDFIRKNRLFK